MFRKRCYLHSKNAGFRLDIHRKHFQVNFRFASLTKRNSSEFWDSNFPRGDFLNSVTRWITVVWGGGQLLASFALSKIFRLLLEHVIPELLDYPFKQMQTMTDIGGSKLVRIHPPLPVWVSSPPLPAAS